MPLGYTIYKGFDLWADVPDHSDGQEVQHSQRFVLLDNKTGAREADVLEPHPRHEYAWVATAESEAAVDRLKTFVDDRRGRAVPFWLPSWHAITELAYDHTSVLVQSIFVRDVRLRDEWALGPARQHIWLFNRDTLGGVPKPMVSCLKVAGFDYEEIYMGTTLGGTYKVLRASVMRLYFVRMAADLVRIEWFGRNYAKFTIPIIEVPQEAPGP